MAYQQPQSGPVTLDTASSLTKGLLCGAIPYMQHDFVTGAAYTQEGSCAKSVASAGIGLATDGASSDIFLAFPAVTLTRYTLFGVFKSNSAAADARALALGYSADTQPIVQIGTGAGTASKVRIWARDNVSNTPAAAVDSTASAFDGTVHTVAITYDSANIACYIDGKFDSSTPAVGLTFTVDRFCVGALYRSSAAAFWAGSTFVGAAWNRVLSATEIASISANPWQPFRDEDEEDEALLYVQTGSGSTGTVAVTNAADTSSAAGTTTVTGTLARTNANDTSSASGTTTVTGSLARTNANDTATASGAVGANITGTVATTNANDTATASGTTRINASSATTNASDTSSASGTTRIGGTSASSNANDTATASGIAGTISGSAACVNANDTAAASGSGGPVVNTKIGGDDVPRYEDEERIEVWERMAKTPRRDDALDKVIRAAYAKATGKAEPVVAKAAPKVESKAAIVTLITYDDEEEDDLEILLLSF